MSKDDIAYIHGYTTGRLDHHGPTINHLELNFNYDLGKLDGINDRENDEYNWVRGYNGTDYETATEGMILVAVPLIEGRIQIYIEDPDFLYGGTHWIWRKAVCGLMKFTWEPVYPDFP